MPEIISTADVRQRIGDLLNRVALRHDEFIIERKGKPLAALVPVERLEQMAVGHSDYGTKLALYVAEANGFRDAARAVVNVADHAHDLRQRFL